MQTNIQRFTVDGVNCIVVGNWAFTCGNLVFHRNDLFNIQKRYPQITDNILDKIKEIFLTTSNESVIIEELKELAKTDKNINMMLWYMIIGYKQMTQSYKNLKNKVKIAKMKTTEMTE